MNAVSWFLYAADVLYNVQQLLCIILTFIILGVAGAGLVWFVSDGDAPVKPFFKISVPLLVLLGVIASAIPSKTTMYAMAASELSEKAIRSDFGQQVLSDTQQILKDYLKSLRGDDKK